jgi:hypothetical protein
VAPPQLLFLLDLEESWIGLLCLDLDELAAFLELEAPRAAVDMAWWKGYVAQRARWKGLIKRFALAATESDARVDVELDPPGGIACSHCGVECDGQRGLTLHLCRVHGAVSMEHRTAAALGGGTCPRCLWFFHSHRRLACHFRSVPACLDYAVEVSGWQAPLVGEARRLKLAAMAWQPTERPALRAQGPFPQLPAPRQPPVSWPLLFPGDGATEPVEAAVPVPPPARPAVQVLHQGAYIPGELLGRKKGWCTVSLGGGAALKVRPRQVLSVPAAGEADGGDQALGDAGPIVTYDAGAPARLLAQAKGWCTLCTPAGVIIKRRVTAVQGAVNPQPR